MKEFIDILRLYTKYCLLFRSKLFFDKILGAVGWLAIIVLGYSVFQIIFNSTLQ
jgi:hypothetical protein